MRTSLRDSTVWNAPLPPPTMTTPGVLSWKEVGIVGWRERFFLRAMRTLCRKVHSYTLFLSHYFLEHYYDSIKQVYISDIIEVVRMSRTI